MADRLEGMDGLLKNLESLTFVQGRQVLGKALGRAATLIAQDAERRAPRRTGKLAASIRVSITERTATSAVAKIGPTKFWGGFNEWGTKRQSPDPFLEPAYRANLAEAVDMIREDLWAQIQKTVNRG